MNRQCGTQGPTTSFLTAIALIYAIVAGITVAAGTSLALSYLLHVSEQKKNPECGSLAVVCDHILYKLSQFNNYFQRYFKTTLF
jgi:hypothetical protein